MFTYGPLDPGVDSLRILILLPTKGSRIECKLENRAFGSKPTYEALSYTWGTEPENKQIIINGESFPVRQNLYDALFSLRQRKPRSLWVDAVCINQNNIPERNAQVSLMAFIYTRAQRVLAWLGQSPSPVQGGYFSDDHWYAMSHSPYWKRLWIIQELVLAYEVKFYLGNHTFGWETVSSTMNPEWAAVKPHSDAIEEQREHRYTSQNCLENLIERFHAAHCSERRDKIYGFLGMVYDGSDTAIKVDYAIEYAELYAQLIKFHQSVAAPLDSPFSGNMDRMAKLMKFSQLVQKVMGGIVAVELKNKPQPSWSNTMYTARGAVVSQLILLGPTPTELTSSTKASKAWTHSMSMACQTQWEAQKVRKEHRGFSHNMISTLRREPEKLDKFKSFSSKTAFGYRKPLKIEDRGFSEENPNTQSEPVAFLGTNALLGLVPATARVGDLLCTFLGCDVTLLLRGVAHEDRFMVVGRAQIHKDEAEEGDEGEWDREIEKAIESELDEGHWTDCSTSYGMNVRLDLGTLQQMTS